MMTGDPLFRGSYVALVTPFKNGAVDEAAFRKLVSWQISEGTKGLIPVGTTGESPTLSHDEHKLVVELCIDEAAGRVVPFGVTVDEVRAEGPGVVDVYAVSEEEDCADEAGRLCVSEIRGVL